MSMVTSARIATGAEIDQPATTAANSSTSPMVGISSSVENNRLTINSARVSGYKVNFETSSPSLAVNSNKGSIIHKRRTPVTTRYKTSELAASGMRRYQKTLPTTPKHSAT